MLGDVDLFALYRWLLAIVCTVYTVIQIGRTLWGWLAYFGSSRPTAVLGRYTMLLLLRMKVRRFAWELCQITGLLAVLGWLLYLHRGLNPGA